MGLKKPPFSVLASPFLLGATLFFLFPNSAPIWERFVGLGCGYCVGMGLISIFHSLNVRFIITFLMPFEVEMTEAAYAQLTPPLEGKRIPNGNVQVTLELELNSVLLHPPMRRTTYSFPLPNGQTAVAKGDRVYCRVDSVKTEFTVQCEPMKWENRVFSSREELERGVRSMIQHGWSSQWTTTRESQTFQPDSLDTPPAVEIKNVAA